MNSTEPQVAPKQVMKPGTREKAWHFQQVACGDYHTIALSEKGEVYTCGSGGLGQLGLDQEIDSITPKRVDALQDHVVIEVEAGGSTSVAITEKGQLFVWGAQQSLEIDNEHNANSNIKIPQQIASLAGKVVDAVACGDFHVVCLVCSRERSMYSWGNNALGQLGHGDYHSRTEPTSIVSMAGKELRCLSAGAAHNGVIMTVKKLGLSAVYTWGSSNMGQTGLGKNFEDGCVPSPRAVILNSSDKATQLMPSQVACGSNHTCVLVEGGDMYVFGDNSSGQLGLGDCIDRFEPTLVSALEEKVIRSIACGGRHTAATVAREWIKDTETTACMNCKSPFTFYLRRHHCRNCGGIFCGKCSSHKMSLLHLGFVQPVRVCDNCFATR